MDEASDAELVRRCRMGERAAFSLLATRHEARLRRLLQGILYSRAEAEDTLQEALLQAYLSLDNLRQAERFGAWLCAIALNTARGRMRQYAQLAVRFEDDSAADVRDPRPQPEQWFEQHETCISLERALAKLPSAEREAIALVYGDDLSHQETARRLGVSVGAVKVRVHRGRRRLQVALHADYAPPVRSKPIRRKVMIPVTIFDVLTIESPLDPRAALATQLAAMPEATREPFLASVSLSLERRHPLGQLMLHSPDPSLTLTTEEQQAYEDATRSLWQHRVVLLKDTNSERALPIWIGPIEAASLAAQLMAQQPLRPLTADLMTTLLRLADLRVEHVTIGELHDQVFYATIKVGTSRQMTEVDCRPSDAINLAALLGVPLYIAEEVMIEAGIVPNSDGRYPISQDSEEQVQYRSLIHER